MGYDQQTWADGTAGGTPLSAVRLNHIEAGIAGKADLDSTGKLVVAQLPDLAIMDYVGDSASQAAMLAKTGQKGDWTVRTDTNTPWFIIGSDPTQLASWKEAPLSAQAVTLAGSQSISGQKTFAGTTTLSGAVKNSGPGIGGVINTNSLEDTGVGAALLPHMMNDIAYNVLRGGTLSTTKNGTAQTLNTNMFAPDFTYTSLASAVGDVWVLTAGLCKVLQWSSRIGVSFEGAQYVFASSIKMEWYRVADSTWQTAGTVVPDGVRSTYYWDLNAGSSAGISQIRVTITANTADTIRLSSLFAVNFQSGLLTEGLLSKAGGAVVGATSLGSNTLPVTGKVRIGDATTDNTGGLEFGGDAFFYRLAAAWLATTGRLSVTGNLYCGSNLLLANVTQTASTALAVTSPSNQLVNATSGAVTLTLPSSTTNPGNVLTIKKIDSSTNAVTVDAGSGGTIDGSRTYTLAAQYNWVTVASASTAGVWYITGKG